MSETKPSRPPNELKVSLEASANAPIVFFDAVPTSGLGANLDIGQITLTARRLVPLQIGLDGQCSSFTADTVITAHLRTNLAGLSALRRAIDGLEQLLQQGLEAAFMGPSASDLLQ